MYVNNNITQGKCLGRSKCGTNQFQQKYMWLCNNSLVYKCTCMHMHRVHVHVYMYMSLIFLTLARGGSLLSSLPCEASMAFNFAAAAAATAVDTAPPWGGSPVPLAPSTGGGWEPSEFDGGTGTGGEELCAVVTGGAVMSHFERRFFLGGSSSLKIWIQYQCEVENLILLSFDQIISIVSV